MFDWPSAVDTLLLQPAWIEMRQITYEKNANRNDSSIKNYLTRCNDNSVFIYIM